MPVKISYPVTVVADLQALMCVDVDMLVILGLLGGQAHEAPNWQFIHEQLIPIMLFHCHFEDGCLLVFQDTGTHHLL